MEVLLSGFLLLMQAPVGCISLPNTNTVVGKPFPVNSSFFSMTSSSEGTFLLDQEAGKVWRYNSKDAAFLEIPVTSKILVYDPKDGKIH